MCVEAAVESVNESEVVIFVIPTKAVASSPARQFDA